jgi:hypothetical protein
VGVQERWAELRLVGRLALPRFTNSECGIPMVFSRRVVKNILTMWRARNELCDQFRLNQSGGL